MKTNDFSHKRNLKVTLMVLPSELSSNNNNIEKTIVQKLVNSMQNICYDNCFIKEIVGISPINNGKVAPSGEVYYDVEFEAIVLTPKVDDIMAGFVQKYISSGVFVQYDVLRCFIKRQCFTQKEWNSLQLNNNLTVRLKTFRFQNYSKTLSCVGELLNSNTNIADEDF